MKTSVVCAAILLLAGALQASAATSSASSSATITPSSLTFKQALAACPGALGSVTFSLGHARVAAAVDVTMQSDVSSSGVETITLTSEKGPSATVVANGHDHTVAAKNVQVKWKGQLACVMPD
jgi:hypothetical protein